MTSTSGITLQAIVESIAVTGCNTIVATGNGVTITLTFPSNVLPLLQRAIDQATKNYRVELHREEEEEEGEVKHEEVDLAGNGPACNRRTGSAEASTNAFLGGAEPVKDKLKSQETKPSAGCQLDDFIVVELLDDKESDKENDKEMVKPHSAECIQANHHHLPDIDCRDACPESVKADTMDLVEQKCVPEGKIAFKSMPAKETAQGSESASDDRDTEASPQHEQESEGDWLQNLKKSVLDAILTHTPKASAPTVPTTITPPPKMNPTTTAPHGRWPIGTFSNPDLRIYRLCMFKNDTKSQRVPCGRHPSLYAIQNNCIYRSNWFLPVNSSWKQDDLIEFFQNYQHGMDMAQWHKDELFATMPQGSIACAIVPNNSVVELDQVCFGMITSKDSFRLQQARDLPNNPVHDHTGFENTFLYHKVEWMCWANLRDLPGNTACPNGAKLVKWLVECSTSCFLEIKKDARKEALRHLQSQKFIQCTHTDFTELLAEAHRVLPGENPL